MLVRRFFCVQSAGNCRGSHRHRWPVKQVTKFNFSESFEEIKSCIFNSDYVAVSLQNTGGHSVPWQKILPIDTAETAYLKAKHVAERFQILQFAVCPFSVRASKLIAHPYNFHLFPRDELKAGLPSYSFSCQSSYLTSMAREGFDFNACVYNGISYLSRAQESDAKVQIRHLSHGGCSVNSLSVHSVADSVFMKRIKCRVRNWRKACKDSEKTSDVADALISSLRKLISGGEVFGSRPSLAIDVCSERQVQLVLETTKEFDDVVPLQVPSKGGTVRAVRIVLTSSAEDKILLEKELKDMEEEQRLRIRGFRELIDLISTSQRPVVAHNSLNDFAFIHSKFLAPLPFTMDEFRSSLHLDFPHVLDVNHLMKEIGPFDKMNNVQSAISYLDSKFFAPVDVNIPIQGENDKIDIHGLNVVRLCELFVKLCSILKIPLDKCERESQLSPSLHCHFNTFSPCFNSSSDRDEEGVRIWIGNSRTVSVNSLVFLWGFQSGISAKNLKDLLSDSHRIFSEDFDVRLVDQTCAVVCFQTPCFSEQFLKMMDSGENISPKLKVIISGGLKAAGYKTYWRTCRSGLWSPDLAESLEQVVDETDISSGAYSQQEQPVIFGYSPDMIYLDKL